MKTDDLLMMMAAAVGVFLIANMSKAKAATPTNAGGGRVVSTPSASSNAGFGNVISTWNGWTYFDSGYVKDAFGNIYYQGEKIADAQWGAV